MIDCARNAVRNVESIKKMIDISKSFGFNRLYLYLEDCYEIPELPYFGYLRGRYSLQELKEIDDYGYRHGVEIIPCIQTLAHLNQIFTWQEFSDINDCNDILLVGEDKTYDLIKKELKAIKSAFRTSYIHIGMDEAWMLGKGKYFVKNGFKSEADIFLNHLLQVYDIAKNMGIEIGIWSDMLYVTASRGGKYYDTKVKFDEKIIEKIPKDIKLIYWDYYHEKKSIYDKNIINHKLFPNPLGFASGVWTWTGFAPNNNYAIKILTPGIKAALDAGLDEIMLTAWGDNGAECPLFSSLPSLFYASELIKGIDDKAQIKQDFYDKIGIKFDDFMKLDLLNIIEKSDKGQCVNPSKYYLYNDAFMGIFDTTIIEGSNKIYKKYASIINRIDKSFGDYAYMSKMFAALAKILSVKSELGISSHKAYFSKDKTLLDEVIKQYKLCIKYIDEYVPLFRACWYKENKPHGFDIQEIRFGGLKARLEICMNRLKQYRDGKIDSIPELEEELLDAECKNKEKKRLIVNAVMMNSSPNRF